MPYAGAQQYRGDVQGELIDEAGLARIPAFVAAATNPARFSCVGNESLAEKRGNISRDCNSPGPYRIPQNPPRLAIVLCAGMDLSGWVEQFAGIPGVHSSPRLQSGDNPAGEPSTPSLMYSTSVHG